MKRKFYCSVVVMIGCLSLMAGSAYARAWKISHLRPQGTAIDNDLRWFSDALKEKRLGKSRPRFIRQVPWATTQWFRSV